MPVCLNNFDLNIILQCDKIRMNISDELSQLTKHRLFVNHPSHDDYLSVTANSIIEKYSYIDIDPFMESFREALSDSTLGAHAMIPITPGANRLRGLAGAVAHPPPLPGRQRKRKAPAGQDSRKKIISRVIESRETEDISDTTTCGNDSDVTSILSDLSTQEMEEVSVTRFTRHASRRGKRKRVAVTRKLSGVSPVTRSSSRTRTDESILDTKSSIHSDSTPAVSRASSTTLLSHLPDRPAPPSFMESSAPSTPPDRPTPPDPSFLLRPVSQYTLPTSPVPVSPDDATVCRESTELYLSTLATQCTQPISSSPMQQDSLDKSSCNSKRSLSPTPDASLTPPTQPHIPQTLPSNPLTPSTDPNTDSHTPYDSPQSTILVADSSLTEIHTPSFQQPVPVPTPSNTFSYLRSIESDLYISPPSDLIPRVPSNKTPRPLIQSPLLEQHPDPCRFASRYDHIPEDSTTTTPISQNLTNILTGVTHSIHKPTHIPHNSPSKFHQNCSPHHTASNITLPTPVITRTLRAPHTRINLSTKCKPAKRLPSLHPVLSIPSLPLRSQLISPCTKDTPVVNTSLQQIPKGLVSSIADRFQLLPGDLQSGKLATTVSTFFNKKPVIPTVRNSEESRAKVQQKQLQDDRRVIGLINLKHNVMDKKKQENHHRQKIVAQRRAEIDRLHKEKFNKKLESKEDKRKAWERQSIRKKNAEEERRKREELEKKRADTSQLKTTLPLVPSSASTTFNTSSLLSTVPFNDVTSYQIDDLDSENTDDEERPRHQIPSWATEPYLSHSLRIQCTTKIDTDIVFPPHHLLQPMELTLLFEYNRYRRARRPYNYRTSSALWTSPMFKTS